VRETATGQSLIEEGREEGREEGLGGAIVAVLEARLGPLPEVLCARLQRVTDPNELEQLVRRAAVTPSLAAFQAELPR